jgi:hypothetical protein
MSDKPRPSKSKRPEYGAVPRGHRRLWVVCYRIDTKWQADGEWFLSRDDAESQARDNGRSYWWASKVVPIDVPVGLLPLPLAERGGR